MSVTETALLKLHDPTPPDEIKQRQGPRGSTLDYVDARYVMAVLDRVCGPQGWQREHRMEGAKVACGIGINVEGVGWVWKWDGAGETDIEGEKGSFSDAFKRAAVSWGVARDLYGPRSEKPARAATTAAAPVSPPPPPNQPWTAEEIASVGISAPAPAKTADEGWDF